jgi:hypothetical protein
MSTRFVRLLHRTITCLALIACFPHVSIANEPCPCADGYTCCAETQRCMADATECGEALREEASFAAHVQTPNSIRDVYATDPTLLRFTVQGCAKFSVAAEIRGLNRIENEMGPWHSGPLPVTSVGGGTYEARFALRDVVSYDGCNPYDEEYPLEGELRLRVVCDTTAEDGVTETIPVYFIGNVQSMPIPSVDRVWPLATPHHFIATTCDRSTCRIAVWHRDAAPGQPLADHYLGATARSRPHLFAQAGSLGFLTDGGSEQAMTAADGTAISSATVLALDLREPMTAVAPDALIVRRFSVPGLPAAMLSQADGSITVLGEAYSTSGRFWGLIVSRIDPSSAVDSAQATAYYPGEALVSSHHDATTDVFVSKGRDAHGNWALFHIRSLDAASSAQTRWDNPFGTAIRSLFFAPDGKQWLVITDSAYLGHPDSGWRKLSLKDPEDFEPVWNRDSVILWQGNDVYTYPRGEAGGAWRTHHVFNGAVRPAALANGGFMVGDVNGVRFLDANGNAVRHVDIPRECRSPYGALTADLGEGWALYAPFGPFGRAQVFEYGP